MAQADEQLLERTRLVLKGHEDLSYQFSMLEQKRVCLEKNIVACQEALHSAVASLPTVIDILSIETSSDPSALHHPPGEFIEDGITNHGRSQDAVRQHTIKSNRPVMRVAEVYPGGVMSEVKRSEIIRASSEVFRRGYLQADTTATDAQDCGLCAANLTSQAARQKSECSELVDRLTTRQREESNRLFESSTDSWTAKLGVDHGESQINYHRRFASEAAEKKAKHNKIVKYTWMIPGVNLFTVPIALAAKSNASKSVKTHEQHIENYSEYLSERKRVRQESHNKFDEATRKIEELSQAQASCSTIAMASQQFQDTAKILVDEVSSVGSKANEIANALSYLRDEHKLTTWSLTRPRLVRSICELLRSIERSSLNVHDTKLLLARVQTLMEADRQRSSLPAADGGFSLLD